MSKELNLNLSADEITWLKVLTYMYYQQNKFSQARPLLEFMSEKLDFDFSVRLQYIMTLIHLSQHQNATNLLRSTLNNNITSHQKHIIQKLLKQTQIIDA